MSLGYLYAPTGGCGADPAAGKNGSRTGTTIQIGAGPVTSSAYCTDSASRLTAVTSSTGGLTIDPASIGYDSHGNATQLGTQTWTYDGADRVTGTSTYGISPTQTLTYGRDSLGRVVSRTASGPETSTARYGFTGTDDSPDLQLTAGNALSERYIGLPGGVLYTKGYAAAGTVWSLSNLHGDVTTTISGTTVSTGFVYDPYGQPLNPTTGVVDPTATPTTRTGGTTDAWHGTAQRGYEHTGGLNQMLMGARTYLPALGIFTATDPIEGGNTTTYTCPQDPINQSDLDGQATSDPIRLGFGGAIAVPAPAAPSGQGVLTAIVGVLVGIVSMVAGSSLGGDVVLQRTIPEPGSSDSAKSRKRAYRVYEIYYFNLGKVHTFKYGITGAANNARLRVGVRQCKAMGFSGCDSRIVLGDQTYAGARAIEYGLIKGYARRNGGWCPPGQWRSCK